MTADSVALTNQWNDFLLRELDPYATAKYEILLNYMGDVTQKTCLVVGCGSGEFCAWLSLRGAKVTAVDIDEKSVELAKQTAIKLGTKFETAVAKIDTLSENQVYDFVIATDVIEHIENDQAAIEKLRRLTATDGHLVVTVPALQSLFGYHDEVLGHFRRYSAKTLRAVIAPEFEISKMRYFGFFLIPVTLLVSCILRKPYPVAAVGKAQQDKTLLGRILDGIFKFEKKFNLGLGTSLLLIARPKISAR